MKRRGIPRIFEGRKEKEQMRTLWILKWNLLSNEDYSSRRRRKRKKEL